MRTQPDFAEAALFAARVRAHGFTFSTGRLLAATEDEAGIVLEATPEQRRRLFKDAARLENAMVLLPAAHGLVHRGDMAKLFPRDRWRMIASEGDFSLFGCAHSGPMATRTAER